MDPNGCETSSILPWGCSRGAVHGSELSSECSGDSRVCLPSQAWPWGAAIAQEHFNAVSKLLAVADLTVLSLCAVRRWEPSLLSAG